MLTLYYGRQYMNLYFLPMNFLKDVHNELINDTFDINIRYPFYVCKLDGEDGISSVKFVLGESCWKSIPVIGKMERFSVEEVVSNNWLVLNMEGKKYLLVDGNPMIQDRIIGIKYE